MSGPTMREPDETMMARVHEVAAFMRTLDDSHIAHSFAADVTILENFAPYIFRGPNAVADWMEGFRGHAEGLSDLAVSFGAAQDYSSDGATAFFTLPTQWTGRAHTRAFAEDGGWSFVLHREGGEWRIAAYGWSVTAMRFT